MLLGILKTVSVQVLKQGSEAYGWRIARSKWVMGELTCVVAGLD